MSLTKFPGMYMTHQPTPQVVFLHTGGAVGLRPCLCSEHPDLTSA